MPAIRTVSRRFEFVGGNSAKFWTIAVQGKEIHVGYGRIGTAGQQYTKTYKDANATAKEADKLIAQKMSKGYVETS